MNVLVTGGTGFIGRNLVKQLHVDGFNMHCTVRKTSDTTFIDKFNITKHMCDIRDIGSLEKVFDEAKPEIVFHAAANVMAKEEKCLMDANVSGTKNICKMIIKHNVPKLIYLSSVSVVSGNSSPINDDMPYKASNAYGRSKIEAEKQVVELRKRGVKVAILRPCMVYGEDEPHALNNAFSLVLKRRLLLPKIEEIESLLQLVSVNNVVSALKLCYTKEEAFSGTFIVADKEVLTIRKFIEILYSEISGREPICVPSWLVNFFRFIPYVDRKINQYFKDRTYDITRIENILGYDPKISTEDGLSRTIRDWKTKKGI